MNKDEFKDCIFRLRSIKSLLDYNELENTEIYFCPFDEEDDIMEGSLNLYWQADEILWDSLFSNYFVVFMVNYLKLMITDPESRKIPDDICWYLDRTAYGMGPHIEKFLNHDIVNAVKKRVLWNNHKVDEDEMLLYLNLIHYVAFDIARRSNPSEETSGTFPISEMAELLGNMNGYDEDRFNKESRLFSLGFEWMRNYPIVEGVPDWYRWICMDFPYEYLKNMKAVLFPKWYLSSFCSDCSEPRLWEVYADEHKGVCLVFKTYPFMNPKYKSGIRLRTCHEYSSNKSLINDYHLEPVRDVEYVSEFPDINFFEMLGTLPQGMLDNWLHDKNGNKSCYYKHYYDNDEKTWREYYWREYEYLVTRKSTGWKEQAEKRVVLENLLFENYSLKENRKIKYKFEDLQGIIWGLHTSESDKKKIRSIINDLCKRENRSDFKFYQLKANRKTRKFIVEDERIYF